ncbi:MAG: fibronectin type III domain-containing protein, partial [Kiritimatiellae bacterium]|nr:fibronectin type III domain-containing protein [Kiritimatiellia bacterium]
ATITLWAQCGTVDNVEWSRGRWSKLVFEDGTASTPPAAPSGLAAVPASSSRINLSWTDNSDNEDGFKIERRQSGTDPWVRIATPAPNASAHTDTGLPANTHFYYKVNAYNTAGNSPYSNLAAAMTEMWTNDGVAVTQAGEEVAIANNLLARVFDISGERVCTKRIENKRSGRIVDVSSEEEFAIHLMDGSRRDGSHFMLQRWEVTEQTAGAKTLTFRLTGATEPWEAALHVEMKPDEWFLRKWLEIRRTDTSVVEVDRIDVDSLVLPGPVEDFPPAEFRDDRDRRRVGSTAPDWNDLAWRPWLGQPVYAGDLFLGVEFPASDNRACIRIEAEDMALTGYAAEEFLHTAAGDRHYASGGKVIGSTGTGTAAWTFAGIPGAYDLVIGYIDENNGDAHMKVRIHGGAPVDEWDWSANLGDPSKHAITLKRRMAAAGVVLQPGDVVTLEGTAEGGEQARVDYIEFRPVGSTRGRVTAGYDWGRTVGSAPYATHSSVCGAAPDAEGVADTFFAYIEAVRARPPRMYVAYNSWYDFKHNVTESNVLASVRLMNQKLTERGVAALDAYQIDDGWDKRDTSHFWEVDTAKFPGGFGDVQAEVERAGSRLALWLSPMGGYGGADWLAAQGYEVWDEPLNNRRFACLAGPNYTRDLKATFLWYMSQHGVNAWKLDGLFPYGWPCGDTAHGHPSGQAGRYCLTAAVEALIDIFSAMREQDKDVFINLTNFSWVSPWFLMYVDTLYHVGGDQGFIGEGGDRDQALTWRDYRQHLALRINKAQIPPWGINNAGPVKGQIPDESLFPNDTIADFRKYMYMVLARGSQLKQLYFAPSILTEEEWDVTAEAINWARANSEAILRGRMIGGNPAAGEVYGYSGWTTQKGMVALRNPTSTTKTFQLTFDRSIGVIPGTGPFTLKTVLPMAERGTESGPYAYGATVSVTLGPFEVRIWECSKHTDADVKIDAGATWRYRKGTAEAAAPPAAWRAPGFDDSAWAQGPAPFGYGDGPYGTELGDMKDSYTCIFLRAAFEIEQPALISELRISAQFDDGFVMWINGREVGRTNMPAAAGTFHAHDATAADSIKPRDWTATLRGAAMPVLTAGGNVVAVQVFNCAANSSDLTFDGSLSVVRYSLSAAEDADQDAMPDDWENENLSELSDPSDRRAAADPDGDGLSNIEEYIAGTDPTGPGSTFDVSLRAAGGGLLVSFPTVEAAGTGYEGLSRYYALEE